MKEEDPESAFEKPVSDEEEVFKGKKKVKRITKAKVKAPPKKPIVFKANKWNPDIVLIDRVEALSG